jgi:hypothetical protein
MRVSSSRQLDAALANSGAGGGGGGGGGGSGSSVVSSASDPSAGVVMVPTIRVIVEFVGYFARQLSEAYKIDAKYNAAVRRLVERLIYPRIHGLCFDQLRGHDVMARRDARSVPGVRASWQLAPWRRCWCTRVRALHQFAAWMLTAWLVCFLWGMHRWHSRLPTVLAMTPEQIGVKGHVLQALPSDPVDAAGAVVFETCLFARSRQFLAAMESQTIPSKMLGYLVTAIQCALDEVGVRCVAAVYPLATACAAVA